MWQTFKFVAALTLVLSVVLVFIAPTANLEPTAMRAWRAAQMAALAMLAAATIILLLSLPAPGAGSCHELLAESVALGADLVDLDCARLC